jgi:hypothetical protein
MGSRTGAESLAETVAPVKVGFAKATDVVECRAGGAESLEES